MTTKLKDTYSQLGKDMQVIEFYKYNKKMGDIL